MDKWLNHPTVIKIMALAIGLIMWAVVHYEPSAPANNSSPLYESKTIEAVKIEVVGLDESKYVLASMTPQTINLTVRGTKADLLVASRNKENYKLQVDVRNIGAGKHTMPLSWDLPRGIQYEEAKPNAVTVVLEELQTKEFDVAIQTTGSPAEGYIAGLPILKPTNRVHVTLPENTMAQVARVGADLKLDGESSAIKNKSLKLSAYDANGKVIEGAVIDPAVVEVEVPITYPFKTVPIQFVMAGRMPSGLSIGNFEPNAEQVTVYGPKDTLDKIDFIEADLQLDELTKSGTVTIPLSIAAPIKEISPANIAINVEVVLSDTRSLEGLPINWKGLGEGMSMRIVDPATGKADIVVKGSPARLGRLQPGDVSVDADLTGKGPGMHTVQLIVNSPRFIEQSGGTSTATIEIIADVPDSAGAELNDWGNGDSPGDSIALEDGTG